MATKTWSNEPIHPTTDEALQRLKRYGPAEWETYEFDHLLDDSGWTDDEDMVNSPAHYADKEIEVIDYIDDTVPDPYSYCFGNAIKYLSRHMKKNKPKQDLEKCKWYIDRMLEDYK